MVSGDARDSQRLLARLLRAPAGMLLNCCFCLQQDLRQQFAPTDADKVKWFPATSKDQGSGQYRQNDFGAQHEGYVILSGDCRAFWGSRACEPFFRQYVAYPEA